jgi:hypothetical protein
MTRRYDPTRDHPPSPAPKEIIFWPYAAYRIGYALLVIGFAGSVFGYMRLFETNPIMGAAMTFAFIMLGLVGLVAAWLGVIFADEVGPNDR